MFYFLEAENFVKDVQYTARSSKKGEFAEFGTFPVFFKNLVKISFLQNCLLPLNRCNTN